MPDALTAELEAPQAVTIAERPGNPYRYLAAELLATVVKDLTSPSKVVGSDPEQARAWLQSEAYRDQREAWCAAGVSVRTVRRVVG